ncbi:Clavaminate synthase-like protein [Bimuria novae-zelandiae CBS 107.79]|uniref:Clavaminate synthase-like protein n=1 Tax=Bimuria novae-zelandiae CBS 107.79 TaxID=1447943 RepID=A0A6A5URN1_9PLEO|nr:Clavaminate synthase-like protein [Bimuria novae-zelandiae CBS 107.79]
MPTLQAITLQTRQALAPSPFLDPTLLGAGRAVLDLLPRDPETCAELAYQQLHAVPFREVKTCWRRAYTDAVLHQVLGVVEKEIRAVSRDWVGEVVKLLDMALILTGGAGREELIEEWFSTLEGVLSSSSGNGREGVYARGCAGGQKEPSRETERPAKRRKVDLHPSSGLPETLPDTITREPALKYPICRAGNLSLSDFQAKVANPASQTPLIIEGAIEHWPAFGEDRAWKKPSYLLRKMINGRRLVPVEIGRSYTDAGWGQKILSFKQFMDEYMLSTPAPQNHTSPSINGDHAAPKPDVPTKHEEKAKGYLAQHDLFAQIRSLRADIAIPDYCYTFPAPQLANPANVKHVEELEEPLLNAWFGPADTISPLHTDPYHNILAQVVGYKYVRLYAPEETPKMYPRGMEGDGVDMSNTSRVDLDEAMGVWGEVSCWTDEGESGGRDEDRDGYGGRENSVEEKYSKFREARYVEGVLGPGECLYIPTGWWHYVRSLTPSFSVSFWWN